MVHDNVPRGTDRSKRGRSADSTFASSYRDELAGQCLAAFVKAGTLELSLDDLAKACGTSKRMLVHYFGGRENLEERAIATLEERLRAQFVPDNFPRGSTLATVVDVLWKRTIARDTRGVLLVVMELSKRAWSGSARAKAFYDEQQRLWIELLMRHSEHRRQVEEVLQVFQGAVLAFLITGNPTPGRRALMRIAGSQWTDAR